jgi:hypothetical protein
MADCHRLSRHLCSIGGTDWQQFKSPKPVDNPLPPQSSDVSNVTVDPKVPQNTEKEKDVTIAPSDTTQPTSTDNGAVSSGTEQTIQGDVSKPEYTEEQLKNPEQKPNGDEVTEQDKPVDHDKWKSPRLLQKATASRMAAIPRTVKSTCRVLDGLMIKAVVDRVPLVKAMAISISKLVQWTE